MEINHTLSPFTWGLKKVNNVFGKPDNRDLITLFGYMSAGKTEFTYFVARENIKIGVKVCYISLELPEYDMKLRIARKSAGISKIDYQNGSYGQIQKEIMEKTFQELDNINNLYIVKPEVSDMLSIDRTIKEHYDMGCRMFIIDNLDKILGDPNDNIRYQTISSTLQDLKNENSICIILLHHAKKPANIQQAYSPAGMSGMRGSQKILDNSTQVIEIWRDLDPEAQIEEKKKVHLYQYKDTFEGGNGYTEIYFDKGKYVEERSNKPF